MANTGMSTKTIIYTVQAVEFIFFGVFTLIKLMKIVAIKRVNQTRMVDSLLDVFIDFQNPKLIGNVKIVLMDVIIEL